MGSCASILKSAASEALIVFEETQDMDKLLRRCLAPERAYQRNKVEKTFCDAFNALFICRRLPRAGHWQTANGQALLFRKEVA
jgi:hypothetical protein